MINSAYSYYLAEYVNNASSGGRYGTQKKGDIKDVYSDMLKSNRFSPLYKINEKTGAQEYAIDLKEKSTALVDIASSLSANSDTELSGFGKKQAMSSNQNAAIARYNGNESESSDDQYELHIDSLAKPQENISRMLPSDSSVLEKGSYAFDLNISGYSYEFQFNVSGNDTNKTTFEKLSRLFNRSNVGIKATILDQGGNIGIRFTSESTGLVDKQINGVDADLLFTIRHNTDSDSNVVKALGLDNVAQKPANAEFTVNGVSASSETNDIIIDKKFEVTLTSETPGDNETIIGFKPDVEAVLDNIHDLVNNFNSMFDLADDKSTLKGENAGSDNFETSRLQREFRGIANLYRDKLGDSGLSIDENGRISVDDEAVINSADNGKLKDTIKSMDSFKNAILKKANSISIDPMKYVDKKLIAYPNPINSFTKPYVSSIYSGMMYNGAV